MNILRLSFEFELPFGTPEHKAEEAAKEMIGTNVREESRVVGQVTDAVSVKVGNRWKMIVEADVSEYQGHKSLSIDPPKCLPRAEGAYAPSVKAIR